MGVSMYTSQANQEVSDILDAVVSCILGRSHADNMYAKQVILEAVVDNCLEDLERARKILEGQR